MSSRWITESLLVWDDAQTGSRVSHHDLETLAPLTTKCLCKNHHHTGDNTGSCVQRKNVICILSILKNTRVLQGILLPQYLRLKVTSHSDPCHRAALIPTLQLRLGAISSSYSDLPSLGAAFSLPNKLYSPFKLNCSISNHPEGCRQQF